jgi:hypothetical protein
LTGTLNIQEGADGKNTISTFNLDGQTLAQIAADFTTGAQANLGITATLNAASDDGHAIGTVLTFTQSQETSERQTSQMARQSTTEACQLKLHRSLCLRGRCWTRCQ